MLKGQGTEASQELQFILTGICMSEELGASVTHDAPTQTTMVAPPRQAE